MQRQKNMNKNKILLISPNLKGVKGGVNRIQPSLGIGYLAAVLEQKGHDVYVRDTALEGYNREVPLENKRMVQIGESEESIADYVSNLKPDIVGISVLFSNLAEHAHTIANIVKKIDRSIKVILGGNHITNMVYDYIFAKTSGNEDYHSEENLLDLTDKNIDLAMIGESDFQFPKLVEALAAGSDYRGIEGVVFRDGQKIMVAETKTSKRFDILKLPHPARHLMNMEKYFKVGLFHSTQSHSKRVLNVMASRGCPEKCMFCTTPNMWGHNIRWRQPYDIYEEIKNGIEKYNIGEVQFEDDSLTANISHLISLCELIKPLHIPWCTPNGIKINYHLGRQPEMFQRMKDAGCYQVTLGCESGVQRVLDDIIKKNLRLEQIQPAIRNAKKAGLIVHTFWIVGYPGETRGEMEETIKFAAQSGADSFSVAILTPLPGTPIYRK
jgi:magnesium-protoporphyrin IX monomethyl ester (oxidative) cyclase